LLFGHKSIYFPPFKCGVGHINDTHCYLHSALLRLFACLPAVYTLLKLPSLAAPVLLSVCSWPCLTSTVQGGWLAWGKAEAGKKGLKVGGRTGGRKKEGKNIKGGTEIVNPLFVWGGQRSKNALSNGWPPSSQLHFDT
jgi:hypothetical protein